jgi:hypothetical protein
VRRIYEEYIAFFLVCLSWQGAFGVEYLSPGTPLASPDGRWKVSVEKQETGEAAFYISGQGSTKRALLGQNVRHFGAEWSQDSKTLLVYDNNGSGQSDTIVFRDKPRGWEKVYRTPGGFHIYWRLDKWLPNAVRLRSSSGGSSASEAPATVLVPFESAKPRRAAEPAKKHKASRISR